jgi:hypothetical protein
VISSPKPAFRGPMMSTRLSCERLMGAPGQSLIKNLLQESVTSGEQGSPPYTADELRRVCEAG